MEEYSTAFQEKNKLRIKRKHVKTGVYIKDQIFNAIRELAKSRNYDFIFDKSADIVMLYS